MSTIAKWDTLWQKEENKRADVGPSFRHKMRLVLHLVRKHQLSGDILDVACGTGVLLTKLRPFATSLTGCDISEQALRIAGGIFPQAKYFRLDIEKDALPNQFDSIFCTNALEEIENDQAALNHMVSMLKPGGHLLIVTPHRKDYWTEKDVVAQNQRRYERQELKDKIQNSGLNVTEMMTWGWPIYRIWYQAMNRVNQQQVWHEKKLSIMAMVAARIAYFVLFIDDLFRNDPKASILVALAQKPQS